MVKNASAPQEHARVFPGLKSKDELRFPPGKILGPRVRAKGANVWGRDGKCFLDMSKCGLGATVLGNADPDVNRAVRHALSAGACSTLLMPEDGHLAKLLLEVHPWAAKAVLPRCGGESMAVAVRIARTHTQREKVIVCGYHGWHDWALAASIGENDPLQPAKIITRNSLGVPISLRGTAHRIEYGDTESLDALLAQNPNGIAAVVIDPFAAEPNSKFLQHVKTAAKRSGAVFIIDEISSGFRLTTGGAHLELQVIPDIAVFSKAIGNGHAIAAVIGNTPVMASFERAFISSATWTEALGPAAAVATIKKFREHDVSKHLLRIGSQVQAGISELASKYSLNFVAAGVPSLLHYEIDHPRSADIFNQLSLEMLKYGLLFATASTPC